MPASPRASAMAAACGTRAAVARAVSVGGPCVGGGGGHSGGVGVVVEGVGLFKLRLPAGCLLHRGAGCGTR